MDVKRAMSPRSWWAQGYLRKRHLTRIRKRMQVGKFGKQSGMRHGCKKNGDEKAQEKNKSRDIRSFMVLLFPEAIDYPHHFPPSGRGMYLPATKAHADLLAGAGFQESVDEQVSHSQADKNATIATIFLDGRVVELDEAEPAVENNANLLRNSEGFVAIAGWERVVMERNAVDNRNKK
ncbi:hypothetical protein PRK78_005538 [Emydomyces testavorans]|uniref:Uncharacterized protein n=1 Tax=Emydomyces testavorans TaxID=2070801 RepID=A0AAF0DJR3_9EURO|nr:hypothetical protein PRK78_005538 [Emydomyces testavorans]